eukprot:6197536-Pleurochrysis_carterae.AAC.13
MSPARVNAHCLLSVTFTDDVIALSIRSFPACRLSGRIESLELDASADVEILCAWRHCHHDMVQPFRSAKRMIGIFLVTVAEARSATPKAEPDILREGHPEAAFGRGRHEVQHTFTPRPLAAEKCSVCTLVCCSTNSVCAFDEMSARETELKTCFEFNWITEDEALARIY